MTDLPTRDAFAEALHTNFRALDAPGGEMELELFEVSALRTLPRQEGFSIYFHGPAGRFLPQRTYRLLHDRLGELDLFIVPVGQTGETIEYEAVFNRLLPAA